MPRTKVATGYMLNTCQLKKALVGTHARKETYLQIDTPPQLNAWSKPNQYYTQPLF